MGLPTSPSENVEIEKKKKQMGDRPSPICIPVHAGREELRVSPHHEEEVHAAGTGKKTKNRMAIKRGDGD